MIDNIYQEFEDASYTKFRKDLLREKGSAFQVEFLRAVQSNASFLDFIEENVKIEKSGEKIPLCPNILTESEFRQPPVDTEEMLFNLWSGFTPRIACRTSFWANVTFHHIRAGRIQASYLVTNGNLGTNSSRIIDLQLRRQEQEKEDMARNKWIDVIVRRVLRRLGGLQEARGHRSVYVDCPFARSWWREFLVRQVSDDPNLMPKIRNVTRSNKAYWEELVVLVVSRNSILGSEKIRSSFILSLADLLARESDTPLRKAKGVKSACRAIGSIQASMELSILDESELREVTDKVVKLQHDRLPRN